MIIKKSGHPYSILNRFDLLGNDEEALSKAFAYIIGNNSKALFLFLHRIGIPHKNTLNNFKEINIVTEKKRKEGRTDIEIKHTKSFHIIIESKIRDNKISKQRTQYLTSFDASCKRNILCFITQKRDTNKQMAENIQILHLSWFDIINLYDKREFFKDEIINDFLKYVTRNYKMNDQKEILIQDISNSKEIERFRNYRIYRRNQTFGSPLYFAPYFTKNANQPEGLGIKYLSKILGILTLSPRDIKNFECDLLRFCPDKQIVEKWIKGVSFNDNDSDEIFTYYFLDEPMKLNKNLLKDGTINKGRGKGWISAMIPPNRCVTFKEFIKRLIE
ncbi:MAG: hypothetical protein KAW87_06555 [Candidatus Cloacimonetes bacterium]|nr:hypothetical protein [Candidatus Cloacimonadota bacterium]